MYTSEPHLADFSLHTLRRILFTWKWGLDATLCVDIIYQASESKNAKTTTASSAAVAATFYYHTVYSKSLYEFLTENKIVG